jgi:hypothetical protein
MKALTLVAMAAARIPVSWRIDRIKRLSELGTSLGSASAASTNRDQLVIPFLPHGFRGSECLLPNSPNFP